MLLMWILGAVFVGGLAVAIAWGGEEIRPPWKPDVPAPNLTEVLKRYLWFLTIAVGAGIVSGLVMIGAGGRLAMRLLAATAGDGAQGRITEAEEIVGSISLGGTLGFIIFMGVLGGLATGVIFMLVHRFLPPGRWKGIAFGVVALVLVGTQIDPLRPENTDFDVVGPGWLSVVIFICLGLGHGMLLAALAGRYSRALPLLSSERKVIAAHSPLLIFVPGFALLLGAVVGAVAAVILHGAPKVREALSRPTSLRWAQGAGLLLVVIALPGFVIAITDIIGRP